VENKIVFFLPNFLWHECEKVWKNLVAKESPGKYIVRGIE